LRYSYTKFQPWY